MGRQVRHCNGCTLCCTLLPIGEVGKPACQACPHETDTGCGVYAKRPLSCRLWSCAWLLGIPVPRPDRAHYVVDSFPTTLRMETNDGPKEVRAVQVWLDPLHPHAHRCARLRKWLAAMELPALIRENADTSGWVLLPPCVSGEWIEMRENVRMDPSMEEAI